MAALKAQENSGQCNDTMADKNKETISGVKLRTRTAAEDAAALLSCKVVQSTSVMTTE